MFLFDYFPYIEKDIKTNIQQERLRYENIYKLCDEFLKKNKDDFLITGNRSLQKFLGIEEDNEYEVYCKNALSWAYKLINFLAEHVDETVILSMASLVPYQKFGITFNGRQLIIIQALPQEITIKMTKPIEMSGLNIVQPIIQLIQLYQNLYNISLVDKWPKYREIDELIAKKAPIVTGSGEETTLFMENYVKHNDKIVLIGDSAYEVLNGVASTTISILTSLNQNVIAEEFKKYVPGFSIITQSLLLFSDLRLKKTIFVISSQQRERKVIFNIYNSANYEIIPYTTINNYNIANRYVLMRFVLVDLWHINILHALGKIETQYKDFRSARLRLQYEAFKSFNTSIKSNEENEERFLGTYIEEKLEWKLNKKNSGFFREYFPQIEKKNLGVYKSLQ